MTYLAVPIQGQTKAQFKDRLKAAKEAGAEILELRTDYLTDLSSAVVVELIHSARRTGLPVIVTCRDAKQGGAGNWDLKQRTEVLLEAVRAGAEFIDCEADNFAGDVQNAIQEVMSANSRCRLILSAHNFQGPFEDIAVLYESIITVCPQAIPKLVYAANHICDCFPAFDLLHNKDRDAIVFCMGSAGMISRVLAKKFDSFLTFASLDDRQTTAPGQLTIRQAKDIYRWDKIDEQTEILGVIGDPVAHSISPWVFNACFEKDGINAVHLPFHVQQDKMGFNSFMKGVVERLWLNMGGFSVTLPHKTNALDFASRGGDFVEPLASTIGAVNTLKIGFNGIVSAYNTDYAGAMDALTSTMGIERHQLHGVKVACIGAGGAARAVVAGLMDAGAEVTIYNRTLPKAQLLAEEFRCRVYGLQELSSLDAAIVINCTSIGMSPNVDASPVPAEVFKAGMTAFDTVYSPLKTRFLQQAEAAGAAIVTGAEMFIRQAMAQYRIFFGKEPDEPTMRKTVSDRLGQV
ncbi:MAG: shikimate dehydrogenase [Planctomycetes bacterium]|nr:shikimate dehydrogenase [Planctomycetota bacterium]